MLQLIGNQKNSSVFFGCLKVFFYFNEKMFFSFVFFFKYIFKTIKNILKKKLKRLQLSKGPYLSLFSGFL